MAGERQYKNVYTILEKVKKGEISSYYKDKDGLFGKINFYKKPDLIKPYLHWLDEDRLDKIVNDYCLSKSTIGSEYSHLLKEKRISIEKAHDHLEKLYYRFPAHLKKDIFKLYYNRTENLEFSQRDEKNFLKYMFLEKANNPIGKIMAESSNLKSAIFSRNVMMHFLMMLAMMEIEAPDKVEKLMDGLKNDPSEFDKNELENIMNELLNSSTAQSQLDRSMESAQQLCNKIDELLPEETQEEMYEDATSKSYDENTLTVGKLTIDKFDEISQNVLSVKMSMGAVKDKLKKLLDKSLSYFSSRQIVEYDDIFNAEDLGGIEDYVFLHPSLRKVMAENVDVKHIKKVGKIDIYIDISTSMDSLTGLKTQNNNNISQIEFAKSLAAKLKEMNMLNDVYTFNTSVKKRNNDMLSISMIQTIGGTDINKVVHRIVKGDRNAIVITDAQDRCGTYSEKAYFIGVAGANFSYFEPSALEKYSKREQMIVFDGSKIHGVNANGRLI